MGVSTALDVDEELEIQLQLINGNDASVHFDIDDQLMENQQLAGPRRDDLGDVVHEFVPPGGAAQHYNVGMGWDLDNEWMWVNDFHEGRVYAIDPNEDYESVQDFAVTARCMSNVWLNGHLYMVVDPQPYLTHFDTEGNNLGNINMGYTCFAATCSPENNWMLVMGNDAVIHVYDVADNGEIGDEIGRLGDFAQFVQGSTRSICWVDGHPEGQLWFNSANRDNYIWQLSVDTDEWVFIDLEQSTVSRANGGVGAQHWDGIGHDGNDLWLSWWALPEIRIVDDGIIELRLLTYEPKSGDINADDEADIILSIESLGVEPGIYNYLLTIQTTNPENDEAVTTLECSVVISVESPVFNLTGTVTDEANGNAVEGVQVVFNPYRIERRTDENGNYGSADLPLNSYSIAFYAEDYLPQIIEIEVDEPGDVGLDVALLHSECNPNPERIAINMAPDENRQIPINISNDGNGTLTYTTERRLLGDANADPWTLRTSLMVGEDRNDTRIQGAVLINDQFYVAGANNDEPAIYIFDRDGNYVDLFIQPGGDNRGMKDLAWDGGLIWGAIDETIYGMTTAGEVSNSFESPLNSVTSLVWDPDNQWLWISGTTTNFIAVDTDGNQRAEINRGDIRSYGLAWWQDDPDGYPLYVFAKEAGTNRQVLHKANPANGDVQQVAYLDTELGGSPQSAFITNQYDIYSWVLIAVSSASANDGGDRVDIWQIDARKEWMQLEPMQGAIAAGEAEEFMLTLDAAGLPAELFEGEIVFLHDGVSAETHIPVTLNVVEGPVHAEQTLALVAGWSMVSAYLQPDEQDVTVLTQALVDDDVLIMMKDGMGRFYNPEFGFNNIPGWNVAEGYLIKLRQAGELSLEGTTVMADEAIALVEGWQMVSYYPRVPVDAVIALYGLGDALIMAKDGTGNFYNRQFQFSNMGDMMAGRGYLIKLAEDAELVYRLQAEEELAAVDPQRSVYTKPGKLPVHAATSSNMSLLVKSDKPGEVGVYAQGELVGSGIIDNGTCGIAVWGDDPTTPGVDGARPGDALTVKLLSEDNLHDVEYNMLSGDGIWQVDGFQAIEISGLVEIPAEFGISAVYPNPFNSSARISYSLERSGHIELALFDLSGRQVSRLLSGNIHAGSHVFNLDGSSLTSGVYVAQLSADGQISRMKITLIK